MKSRRAALGDRTVLDAVRPQKFGAAAFEETEVGRVVDDPGKIGVLIVNAYRKNVRPVCLLRARQLSAPFGGICSACRP